MEAVEAAPWFREPTILQRFVGAMLDALVLVPVGLLSAAVLDGRAEEALNVTLVAVYMVGLTARDGRTIGKHVMGTQVVALASGTPPSFVAAVVRWAVVLVGPVVGLAVDTGRVAFDLWALVVLLPILRPPLHRGLHDLAAKTVVTSVR